MRLYWEVARRALQRQLAYRTENLAGLFTNGFFGYLRAAVFLSPTRKQGRPCRRWRIGQTFRGPISSNGNVT